MQNPRNTHVFQYAHDESSGKYNTYVHHLSWPPSPPRTSAITITTNTTTSPKWLNVLRCPCCPASIRCHIHETRYTSMELRTWSDHTWWPFYCPKWSVAGRKFATSFIPRICQRSMLHVWPFRISPLAPDHNVDPVVQNLFLGGWWFSAQHCTTGERGNCPWRHWCRGMASYTP